MKEIMVVIENYLQEFAQLPLFDFMQDRSINPRHRLSFAPCMAYFSMSFGDINKYVLRVNEPSNKIQQIVNQYSFEDDAHWSWFITDIEKLGFNPTRNFTQALRFIWSEETKITRQLAYQIAGYTLQADPVIKIVAIEALEAMGNVFFTLSTQVAEELQAITKKEYKYFGDAHLQVENGHAMSIPEAEEFLAEIELTDSQRQEAIDVVEKVFKIFTEWTNELLVYARAHNVDNLVPAIFKQPEYALPLCV